MAGARGGILHGNYSYLLWGAGHVLAWRPRCAVSRQAQRRIQPAWTSVRLWVEHHAANAWAARSRLPVHGLGYCRVDDHPSVAADLNGEGYGAGTSSAGDGNDEADGRRAHDAENEESEELIAGRHPPRGTREEERSQTRGDRRAGGRGGRGSVDGSIYVVGERDEAGACSIDVDTRVSPADTQTSVGVAPVHSYQPWCWTIQAIRA